VGIAPVPGNEAVSDWLFEEIFNAVIPGVGIWSRQDVRNDTWLTLRDQGNGDTRASLYVNDGPNAYHTIVAVDFDPDILTRGTIPNYLDAMETVMKAVAEHQDWAATRVSNPRTFWDAMLAFDRLTDWYTATEGQLAQTHADLLADHAGWQGTAAGVFRDLVLNLGSTIGSYREQLTDPHSYRSSLLDASNALVGFFEDMVRAHNTWVQDPLWDPKAVMRSLLAPFPRPDASAGVSGGGTYFFQQDFANSPWGNLRQQGGWANFEKAAKDKWIDNLKSRLDPPAREAVKRLVGAYTRTAGILQPLVDPALHKLAAPKDSTGDSPGGAADSKGSTGDSGNGDGGAGDQGTGAPDKSGTLNDPTGSTDGGTGDPSATVSGPPPGMIGGPPGSIGGPGGSLSGPGGSLGAPMAADLLAPPPPDPVVSGVLGAPPAPADAGGSGRAGPPGATIGSVPGAGLPGLPGVLPAGLTLRPPPVGATGPAGTGRAPGLKVTGPVEGRAGASSLKRPGGPRPGDLGGVIGGPERALAGTDPLRYRQFNTADLLGPDGGFAGVLGRGAGQGPGGIPMQPGGGSGGLGGNTPQERERTAFLPEDEQFWGTDGEALPGVLGRPDDGSTPDDGAPPAESGSPTHTAGAPWLRRNA
jgi:hypothetical protein